MPFIRMNVPTLDNLRNFLSVPAEILSFLEQLRGVLHTLGHESLNNSCLSLANRFSQAG
jgi:hypothetical protein